jgi:hypothetical protein
VGKPAEGKVLPIHPLPVIGHLGPAYPAVLNEYPDTGTPGVNGVIQKFPDQGRRPVDYFAGCNLPGLPGGQYRYPAGFRPGPARIFHP